MSSSPEVTATASARKLHQLTDENSIDDFAPPITTGMRRVERSEQVPDDELEARLEEFARVRNRGAVEARTAWIR